MIPTFRRLLPAVLAVLVAASAAAQDAAPRFFVERIEVRNAKRVSPHVVIAESRLREGEEYSEPDLRDAATRLNRLPFLLSADFSLEKGSERGRVVLVITINETKPFFYLLDTRPILSDEHSVDVDYSDRLGANDNEAALGFRWFIGRRGAVHVGVFGRDDNREFTQDYSAFVVGYTHYDLFGSRAFATFNLKRPFSNVSGGAISPQLVAGIPLSPNQTLTLTYDETRSDTRERVVADTPVQTGDNERMVSARWTYNTTNEPFLPTSGTLLTGSAFTGWRDMAGYEFTCTVENPFPGCRVDAYARHIHSDGVDLAAARYFELSERNSISTGLEVGWADVDDRHSFRGHDRYDASYGVLHAGISHSLWSREQQKHGDSRFEASVRYVRRDDTRRLYFARYDTDLVQTSVSWVRRSSWGTLRLGVGYAW